MESLPSLKTKLRKHLLTYLPAMARELKANGSMEVWIRNQAKQAMEQIDQLMQQGFQRHEAEEIALSEKVYLAPEDGAGTEDWEAEELEQMEQEYRREEAPLLSRQI